MTRLEQRERRRQHHQRLVQFGQFSWRHRPSFRKTTSAAASSPHRNNNATRSTTTVQVCKRRGLEWKASRSNLSPTQFQVPMPATVATRNEAERLYHQQQSAPAPSSQQQEQEQSTFQITIDGTETGRENREPENEKVVLDSLTVQAMRLVVVDRLLDALGSSSSSGGCTMLDLVMALKGSSFLFDMYSSATSRNNGGGGLFSHLLGNGSGGSGRRHESARKYELMKALEQLERNPSASTTLIASWEQAWNELTTQFMCSDDEEGNDDDDDNNSPDNKNNYSNTPNKSNTRFQQWLLRLQKNGQRSMYARRPMIQKLAEIAKATLLPTIVIHSEENDLQKGTEGEEEEDDDKLLERLQIKDDDDDDKTRSPSSLLKRLDRADQAFVIRFLKKERILDQHVRKSTAVQQTEQALEAALAAEREKQKQLEEEARQRASALMRPLTADEQERVRQAMYARGRPDEVIAQVEADSVQRGSFQRLAPGQWLNDEVLHFFLTVLGRRDEELCAQDPKRKRSHFFKSFFMSKLLNEGNKNRAIDGKYEYKNVKRWSKKVVGKDIFQLDKVIFPINQGGMHWVCAVAFIQERRIQFYDSLGSSGMDYLRYILRYLQDEHLDKKKRPLPDVDDWKLVPCDVENTPRQLNGYDCGVFTCMFIDFVSKDCPLVFDQSHVTQCRERIALSILNGTAIM
ncbi:hypothetical protein ACA910_009323 [Epithemia clementina (nom. ined.)]